MTHTLVIASGNLAWSDGSLHSTVSFTVVVEDGTMTVQSSQTFAPVRYHMCSNVGQQLVVASRAGTETAAVSGPPAPKRTKALCDMMTGPSVTTYKLSLAGITHVCVLGRARLHVHSPMPDLTSVTSVGDAWFVLKVSTPPKMARLEATVISDGRILLGHAEIDNLKLSVLGNGTIRKVEAVAQCTATIVGKGIIGVTKAGPATKLAWCVHGDGSVLK